MSNPYRRADQISTSRQRGSKYFIVVLLGVALSSWLLMEDALQYLQTDLSSKMEQILFRFAAILTSVMALQTYGDVVRSPILNIISIHPVLARPLLQAIVLQRMKRSWIWLASFWILLFPLLAINQFEIFALASVLLCGSWVGGIGIGYAVNLASIWAARSPKMTEILDLARGQNSREQAAFIYAPGVALVIVGLALALAVGGLRASIEGNVLWSVFLLLPFLLGIVGYAVANALMEEEFLRVSSILTDIDAHWNAVEEGEDPNAVYLDWMAQKNPELLRVLRAGWREHRIYPVLAWCLGLFCSILFLTDRLAEMKGGVIVSCVLLGTLSAQLAKGDPNWLDRALGIDSRRVMLARARVSFLYGLGIVIPTAIAGMVKQGLEQLSLLLSFVFFLAMVSILSAWLAKRGQWFIYLPVALVIGAFWLRMQ